MTRASSQAWFHSKEGFFVRRWPDGSVAINWNDGEGPAYEEEYDLLFDEDTWASIVAHVSEYGDTAEGFGYALRFHKGLL